jgi:hypothetical protein
MRLGSVRLGGEFILGVHDAPSEACDAHRVHSALTVGRSVERAGSRRSGSSIPPSPFRVADVGEHAADRGAVPRVRFDQLPRAMRTRRPARRRVDDRRRLFRRTTRLTPIDAHVDPMGAARPGDERREYREREQHTLSQPPHRRRTLSIPARDDMRASYRPKGVTAREHRKGQEVRTD